MCILCSPLHSAGLFYCLKIYFIIIIAYSMLEEKDSSIYNIYYVLWSSSTYYTSNLCSGFKSKICIETAAAELYTCHCIALDIVWCLPLIFRPIVFLNHIISHRHCMQVSAELVNLSFPSCTYFFIDRELYPTCILVPILTFGNEFSQFNAAIPH